MVYDVMNNFDHYAAAQDLISCLSKEGYQSDAALLQSVLDDGCTGTEILMGLRFYLSEIVLRTPMKTETNDQAYRLLAELNKALE